MKACDTLLCDNCKRPGRCCSGFALNFVHQPETNLEALVALATAWPSNGALGLPFMPLWRTRAHHWLYWCPLLGRDGRCTDYENRPDLCRTYQAGSDMLCAMHIPVPDVPPVDLDVFAKPSA